MPFRVPSNYEGQPVMAADPGQAALWNYIVWLRRELAVAEATLAQMEKPTKPPEKKP